MAHDEAGDEIEASPAGKSDRLGGKSGIYRRPQGARSKLEHESASEPLTVSVAKVDAKDEEDDYMSMALPETDPKETKLQRLAREKRERMERSHRPAKKEDDKQADLDLSLATAIDSSNKGFKMMEKLGFKGGALGKGGTDSDARVEPIRVEMRDRNTGIGVVNEKKRKFREKAEKVQGEEKKMRLSAEEFRARAAKEREERRLQGQLGGAMRVAGELAEKADAGPEEGRDDESKPKSKDSKKPLKSVNVLWRGHVRQRVERERSRRMRYDLEQGLSRLPTYDDVEEDNLDRQAFGREEEELDEEDPELDAFNALEPDEKLAKVLEHLRTTHRYCFWCKAQYADEELEGCPGLTEDEHG